MKLTMSKEICLRGIFIFTLSFVPFVADAACHCPGSGKPIDIAANAKFVATVQLQTMNDKVGTFNVLRNFRGENLTEVTFDAAALGGECSPRRDLLRIGRSYFFASNFKILPKVPTDLEACGLLVPMEKAEPLVQSMEPPKYATETKPKKKTQTK